MLGCYKCRNKPLELSSTTSIDVKYADGIRISADRIYTPNVVVFMETGRCDSLRNLSLAVVPTILLKAFNSI